MEVFLWKVGEAGFSGINNFPTIGMIDGTFRAALEETGMGYDKEVKMIALAHEMGFFTTAYVFNPEEARKMTKAGCDCILATWVSPSRCHWAKATMSLKEAAERTAKIARPLERSTLTSSCSAMEGRSLRPLMWMPFYSMLQSTVCRRIQHGAHAC